MTYKTDITETNGFPFLGITREDNHRWLLRPSDSCPVDAADVVAEYNRVFTAEIKEEYIKYITPSISELENMELQFKIEQARAYLNSTDWYVTRKIETGVEIPVEVTTKRAEARLIIN